MNPGLVPSGGRRRFPSPRLGLAAVLLLAAGLRLVGIRADLPHVFHPDEPFHVKICQRMIRKATLNPRFFNYPSLFFYVNTAPYPIYYAVGRWAGVFHSRQDLVWPEVLTLGVSYTRLPSAVLMGRLITVLFGIGTVWLAILIGRRLSGSEWGGLLAGLLVTVSPTEVTQSRHFIPNIQAGFFVMAALWASARFLDSGRTRDIVWAGLLSGLAAGTKYNAGVALVIPVVACWLRNTEEGAPPWRRLFQVALSAGLAFVASTPYMILDVSEFVSDFRRMADHYTGGHLGEEGNCFQFYMGYLWHKYPVPLLLAGLTLGRAVVVRAPKLILAASFPLAYLAVISAVVVRNDRTIVPLIPPVLLMAALAVVWIVRAIPPARGGWVAGALLAGLSIGRPLTITRNWNRQLGEPDSRPVATAWVRENLPAGTRLALESYGPFVDTNRYDVLALKQITDRSPDWYVDNRFEYVIFSKRMYDRFFREPERYAAQMRQYEEFFARFPEKHVVTNGGFLIRIHAVPPDGNSPL